MSKDESEGMAFVVPELLWLLRFSAVSSGRAKGIVRPSGERGQRRKPIRQNQSKPIRLTPIRRSDLPFLVRHGVGMFTRGFWRQLMSHHDIRIGTLAPMDKGAAYLEQILPHGFESFSLTCWEKINVDLPEMAKKCVDTVGDRAVIGSVGVYGNPLQNETTAKDFGRMIDAARLFNTDIVTGFTGAIEGKPLPESIPQLKKVWGELSKRAADQGVKIAFENCDMSGWWHDVRWNIAHSPTAWEMIFDALPGDHIGLEWEPCHQMVSLIDPIPQLRKWLKKVIHVHGKDATIAWDVVRESGIRGGKPYVWHRTPGFGDTNWTDVISILRMGGFKGSIDIEGWHDPVYRGELEMTGQVHALNYLKDCRGGAFVANPK
jgi:sugar phosphate isomerase/epimerase